MRGFALHAWTKLIKRAFGPFWHSVGLLIVFSFMSNIINNTSHYEVYNIFDKIHKIS